MKKRNYKERSQQSAMEFLKFSSYSENSDFHPILKTLYMRHSTSQKQVSKDVSQQYFNVIL
jgi:hypothetical protein